MEPTCEKSRFLSLYSYQKLKQKLDYWIDVNKTVLFLCLE